MAVNFPDTPVVDQVYDAPNGASYRWNGTLWISIGNTASGGSGASITVGDVPPTSPAPAAGALWWNSVSGQLYIYFQDANTTQWVPANPTPVGVAIPGTVTLCSEQVAVGGETQLNVTIPLNTKRVELDIHSTAATSADPSLLLQTVESGVVFAGNNHGGQQLYSQAAGVGASSQGPQTSWSIGGVYQVTTFIKLSRRGGGNLNWAGAYNQDLVTSAGQRYFQAWAIDGGASWATTTGFRITLGTSSFGVGSYFRAYVVT